MWACHGKNYAWDPIKHYVPTSSWSGPACVMTISYHSIKIIWLAFKKIDIRCDGPLVATADSLVRRRSGSSAFSPLLHSRFRTLSPPFLLPLSSTVGGHRPKSLGSSMAPPPPHTIAITYTYKPKSAGCATDLMWRLFSSIKCEAGQRSLSMVLACLLLHSASPLPSLHHHQIHHPLPLLFPCFPSLHLPHLLFHQLQNWCGPEDHRGVGSPPCVFWHSKLQELQISPCSSLNLLKLKNTFWCNSFKAFPLQPTSRQL